MVRSASCTLEPTWAMRLRVWSVPHPSNCPEGCEMPWRVCLVQPVRATKIVKRVLEALNRDPNVLLVGPPGTGKSVALEDLRLLFEGRGVALSFDPDTWDGGWS